MLVKTYPKIFGIFSNHENTPSVWVKVTVTKPVWFRVRGLRQVLKTNNVTERRNRLLYRYHYTEPLFSN
jgi:hypothetical protein